MSENIFILMIGVSTFFGSIGLIDLLWAVRTGQFYDESKFIDATHFDNEEDLQDAAIIEEKKKAHKRKKKKEYRPAD